MTLHGGSVFRGDEARTRVCDAHASA
jgi:hypothetical protein